MSTTTISFGIRYGDDDAHIVLTVEDMIAVMSPEMARQIGAHLVSLAAFMLDGEDDEDGETLQ